jgi:protein gp37
MGKNTGIEWTDSTWNPIRGCSRVSEGCRNCYAESVAARFSGPGQAYEGLAEFNVIGEGKPEERVESRWTGAVRLIESHLEDPIRWKAPRKIFVNSMSDLFHDAVKDDWLVQIFAVMQACPQHTFQVLTKRPERMRDWINESNRDLVSLAGEELAGRRGWCHAHEDSNWPLRNVQLGVSIEDQESANHRLPILAQTSAAVRIVSYEPALGPVKFETALPKQEERCSLNWIICGGESGPRARPMDPEWARSARRFCSDYQIPFFFKQWGEWLPYDQLTELAQDCMSEWVKNDAEARAYRMGKHNAGAILDGVEWKEFPQ